MISLTVRQVIGLEILVAEMSDADFLAFYNTNREMFLGDDVKHLNQKAIEIFDRIEAAEQAAKEAAHKQAEAEAAQKAEQQKALAEVAMSPRVYTEKQTRDMSVRTLRQNRFEAAAKALEMDFQTASRQRLQWIVNSLQEAIKSKRLYGFVLQFIEEASEKANGLFNEAADDNGEFEEEMVHKEKEGRRQKAVAILRKFGFSEVADVLLGADPEDFMDEIQAAADSDEIFVGIKKEWIFPIIQEIEKGEAIEALEDWAVEISNAVCVLDPNANREDAFKAKEALRNAYRVDLRPYLWQIENMVVSGQYPPKTILLLSNYAKLGEVAYDAQDAEEKTRASFFRDGVVEVIEEAMKVVFEQTKPNIGGSKTGKTEKDREQRPNKEAERRARQLERAGNCLAMKGQNPGVAKFGEGKKSKRAENDPHRSGK